MGPDPYRDWLAITTDDLTPNHYELLGITLFTADAAAVRQAYEDRYALVRRYEVGNYGDRASVLMAELSDAYRVLTNEQQKAQYDRQLRETQAARETRTDVAVRHDTLVEQISELEEIIRSETQLHDPLGAAALPNADGPASMPVPAASNAIPRPFSLPMKEAGERGLTIPVWLAALGTCSAGLLVIGAIAVAISLFGSRDDHATVAAAPSASNLAGELAAGGQPAAESPAAESPVPVVAGNASEQVQWSGRLARVLVDEAGTLHLLVAASDRLFEAKTKDRNVMKQLADYVCLAEDAQLADEVKVAGTVVDQTVSFFDPERRLRADQDELAVLELQSLELVENTHSGAARLTAEEEQTLLNLRSAGRYTQFAATARSAFESNSQRFQASFHGRDYLVEIPAGWLAVGVEIGQGQQVTVVTRTTGRYESPTGGAGFQDLLLLELETINQPSFQQVVQSPSHFTEQTLTYPATLHSTLLKGTAATLSLEVQSAGRHFSIKGLAGIKAGQDAFFEKLDGRDSLLVELKVAEADSPATYEVISLTRLNDANDRVVFDAVATSKPEPPPLVMSPAARPATSLALTGLPDYVDLPPLSSQTSVRLTPADEVAEFEIEFASDLITLDAAYGFVAKQVDDPQTLQWDIYLQKTLDAVTQEAIVAHLDLTDNHFAFRWTENAGKLPAGQLRNCLMRLKSGDQSHDMALRSPLKAGARRLPSEEDKFQVKFELEDLPSSETLRLDVDVSYAGSTMEAPGRTNTATRGKRLDFKIDTLADVEIQVALPSQQDNSLTLHALPRYQLNPSRQFALSTEAVDDHERRIRQSGIKAERGLAKAQNMFQTASNAYSRASDSATRAKFGAIIETQRKAIAANQKNLAEMQQVLDSVDSLRALVAAVKANTLIRYQVYAQKDDTRLLLVDGGYRDQEAFAEPATSGSSQKAAGIDGTWQLIRFEFRGQQINRPNAARLRLQNGQYSVQFGSTVAQGVYEIDNLATPPTISFNDTGNPAVRQVGILQQSGTFKLTSNAAELSIEFSTPGVQRRGSGATLNSGSMVSVYRRVE